ncbi:MAG TPA: citrate lyase subunit alpha [Thermoanaerobacterales bacterium]|nr:citrate lyase subunit alpha [Thermoanaerobacterales bacterium]
MLNAIGREIPEGLGTPYSGEMLKPSGRAAGHTIKLSRPHENKVLPCIKEAIKQSGLKDGMTISFHHHLREGDHVVSMVLAAIDELGIRDLKLAPSSLNKCHDFIIDYIKKGVITSIETSGLRGALGKEISRGLLKNPVIIRSHGGRPRAIETGELHIDIAFIAAPCADSAGNINGVDGPSAFGSIGYAMVDAKYADTVIAITDNLRKYPIEPISIPSTLVDYVVCVDSIGDPEGIMAGAVRFTRSPRELLIADLASKVILNSGLFKDGFSMQMGSGGASLAVIRQLKDAMKEKNIRASFGVGGISGPYAKLLEEGLVEKLLDVQCFDLQAVESLKNNKNHLEMDASYYANAYNKGCAVNNLDIVILSALEIDTDFNVNVITGSDGEIMGASGGHSDAAYGAKLTIITTPLMRGRLPIVVDRVQTIITPGSSIDVVVTERGIAVNPKNAELNERLKDAGLPVCSIEELKYKAEKITGKPDPVQFGDKIVGIVEYRDGSIIDVIRNVID